MKQNSFILAVDKANQGVGYNGKMAWHVPEDLKIFKEYTLNKNIVMGKNTYPNLPKLNNRKLFLISNQIKKQTIDIGNNKNINIITEQELFYDSQDYIIAGGATLLNSIVNHEQFMNTTKTGCITYIEFKNNQQQYDTYATNFIHFIENNYHKTNQTILTNNEKYIATLVQYIL